MIVYHSLSSFIFSYVQFSFSALHVNLSMVISFDNIAQFPLQFLLPNVVITTDAMHPVIRVLYFQGSGVPCHYQISGS